MSNALRQKRRAAERRFRAYGLAAIVATLAFLGLLLVDILWKALPAFTASRLVLPVRIEAGLEPAKIDYAGAVKEALRGQFPEASSRSDRKKLTALLSSGAADELRERVIANPALMGTEVTASVLLSDEVDLHLKGFDRGQLDEKQVAWLAALQERGMIESGFAWTFLLNGDSREPELAGIRGALLGSILTILVTLALALPLGVAAALYLEEFAPKNRLTDLIEVNINNLAAVPSIIFGLLGLAVFLNLFGLPRSAPLAGGLVLALLVLPTIIIASRAAIRSVPPSIKEAALGVGASHQQAVFHHVLPLALPGILTGTILGVARALGETAPLLMIGMVAFIADIPSRITDAATVLPVQVFLWSDLPEAAFKSRTAAAIVVLLAVLILFNALAIYLRKTFERRW
jgi:phosphate transport system permease protein